MALVAIDAVVDVAGNIVVLEVRGIVAAMATSALEDRVIVGIDVAGCAHPIGIAVIQRELRILRVIEGRARPGGCVVAVLTALREELWLRRMARIRRVLIIGLVAAVTCRWKSHVVAIDVAIGALARRNGVRPGERERGLAVVKDGVCPDGRVVAEFAGSGKASRGVGRIVRARIVLLVAVVAERAVQGVVVTDMAVDTLPRWHSMRSGQREACGRVIKLGIDPGHSVMAVFAGRREARMGNRSRGGSVVLLVTSVAQGAIQRVVVVDVAVRTLPRRGRV